MGLPFTNDEYRWILDCLSNLQELLTPEAQRAFIGNAFNDSPRRIRIATGLRYSRRPRDFVVDALRYFGEEAQEDIPGRKTVGVFLREALDCLGEGPDATTLRDLLIRYYPGALIAHAPAEQPAEPPAVPALNADAQLVSLAHYFAAMEQAHRVEVNFLLDQIAETSAVAEEVVASARDLQTWAGQMLAESANLNAELRSQLESLADNSANASNYLTASIPIIPGFLSYNVEVGSQHGLDLGKLWERIKKRFRKGDGAEKGSHSGPSRAVLNRGRARGVFAGVGRYADDSFSPLQYPASDMIALANLLAGRYTATNVLTDEQGVSPTNANIRSALIAQAAAAEAGDLLLFAFSGHGILQDGKSYLIPRDAAYITVSGTAIPLDDVRQIMLESAARAKVILLDACHAGAQIGKGPEPMTDDFIRHVFEQARGICVLSSSTQSQTSWESSDFGHGVYIRYLLEALIGRADRDGKGFVTVTDAHRYASGMVKRWAADHHKIQQPTLDCQMDGDIVLHHYA
ncbi:MAG: caspase family protein [Thermoflexales bacterium]|nr:caspase family protein [Thermoflexales bacterium]